MKSINIYKISNNLKQYDVLLKMIKLLPMILMKIQVIYYLKFRNSRKHKTKRFKIKKKKKEILLKAYMHFMKAKNKKEFLILLIYFSLIEDTGLKTLTAKYTFQRLSIIFSYVKAGNTSQNLLNEIC